MNDLQDLQLRTAVADYLEILDAQIAFVTKQLAAAVHSGQDPDPCIVGALRDELSALNELYGKTEDSVAWDALRAEVTR